MTEIGMVRQMGKKRVSRGHHAPIPRDRVPSVPKKIWNRSNYAQTVWPRATKFDVITNVDEQRVSRGWATFPSQGARLQRPQYFGISYVRTQIRRDENLTGSTTNADARSVCGS